MAEGPARGLAELEAVVRNADGALDRYRWLHLLHGELSSQVGRTDQAKGALRRALELAGTEPEQRHVEARLRELDPEE
jgi:RNA polymerase sigma-70 factor (ECF subfamily)